MSEMTQEDALRQADALAGQALKETEARCRVPGSDSGAAAAVMTSPLDAASRRSCRPS